MGAEGAFQFDVTAPDHDKRDGALHVGCHMRSRVRSLFYPQHVRHLSCHRDCYLTVSCV
jgi:hypothetical protein